MNNSLTLSNVQLIKNSAVPSAEDLFALALASGNFDGFQGDDLAVGIPKLDFGARGIDKGGVEIFASGQWGPQLFLTQRSRLFTQDSPGILDVATQDDRFGHALAVGDFNNDGKDDLAIGAIGESLGSYSLAGGINLIFGSAQGLTAQDNQFWHKDIPGILGIPSDHEYFGRSLAVGDFDGDGYDDLAAGGTTHPSFQESVSILHGSAQGLTTAGNQLWEQGEGGLQGISEEHSYFGHAMATGDFNGDGKDDLAISEHYATINSKKEAGAVSVLFGSSTGLTAANNQYWHQDSAGVEDVAEAGDFFGSTLAAADFNGDGKDDLAIGASYETVGEFNRAGAVNVLYGSSAGLSGTNNQQFHQGTPGMDTDLWSGDSFGQELATGDFNNDGYADLAVGVTKEDVGMFSDAGEVNVLYGSANGLSTVGNQTWHQNMLGVGGSAANDARFGKSLTVGDFNHDGYEDLAVGSSLSTSSGGRNGRAIKHAGSAVVLYGSANGLTPNLTLQARIGNMFGDTIRGTAEGEIIHGQAGIDFLRGDGGNDIVIGGNDNDFLHGDAGDDILFGGPGRDRYKGGLGADVFVINAGVNAYETISDFKDGEDRLGLLGISFSSLSVIRVGTSSTGIMRSGSLLAILENTAPSQITTEDFVIIGQTAMMGLNDVPFVQI